MGGIRRELAKFIKENKKDLYKRANWWSSKDEMKKYVLKRKHWKKILTLKNKDLLFNWMNITNEYDYGNINLFNIYGKNVGDHITEIVNSKRSYRGGSVIQMDAIDNSINHKNAITGNNIGIQDTQSPRNNKMLIFHITLNLKKSNFVNYFTNLSITRHPLYNEINWLQLNNNEQFYFIHNVSLCDKYAPLKQVNNNQNGIVYNENWRDLVDNKAYDKTVNDRRKTTMYKRFSEMKAWVYQTRNTGAPKQDPRDYTNEGISEQMKSLLSMGPKHVSITLMPDIYEMYELYTKMDRIMKGRFYAFCKINKYSNELKMKRKEEIEQIIANTVRGRCFMTSYKKLRFWTPYMVPS